MIAHLMPSTSISDMVKLAQLRNTKLYDRSKGKSLKGKSYYKGCWINQRKGPHLNERENARRYRQILTGMLKVSK